MKNNLHKLTPQIVEACLNQESGQHDERTLEGDGWLESETFNVCVISSERVHARIIDTIGAICGEGTNDRSIRGGVEHLRELLQSGKVTFKHVQVITNVCRQFFFLGWHARGEAEGTVPEAPAVAEMRLKLERLRTVCDKLTKQSEAIESKIERWYADGLPKPPVEANGGLKVFSGLLDS